MRARRATAKEKIFEQMTSELFREIDKIAPNYVSISTVPNFLDVRSFIWKNFRQHLRMTFVIDWEKFIVAAHRHVTIISSANAHKSVNMIGMI